MVLFHICGSLLLKAEPRGDTQSMARLNSLVLFPATTVLCCSLEKRLQNIKTSLCQPPLVLVCGVWLNTV